MSVLVEYKLRRNAWFRLRRRCVWILVFKAVDVCDHLCDGDVQFLWDKGANIGSEVQRSRKHWRFKLLHAQLLADFFDFLGDEAFSFCNNNWSRTGGGVVT